MEFNQPTSRPFSKDEIILTLQTQLTRSLEENDRLREACDNYEEAIDLLGLENTKKIKTRERKTSLKAFAVQAGSVLW